MPHISVLSLPKDEMWETRVPETTALAVALAFLAVIPAGNLLLFLPLR
jgi:hypothetical protein